MLYSLLMTIFTINCFFLILIILIQQGKSSMGLGAMGGSTQMLFGGSGGQDIFQKTTWVMGAIFMGGSLMLAMYKNKGSSQYLGRRSATQQMPVSTPAPESTESEPVEESA